MTAQCQTMGQALSQTAARNRRSATSESPSIFTWLRQAHSEIRSQIEQWMLDRKIARTRLSIQNLPEHIRQDIGWPAIDDRLPMTRPSQPTRANTLHNG